MDLLLEIFRELDNTAFFKGLFTGGTLATIAMYFNYKDLRAELKEQRKELREQREYYEEELRRQKKESDRELTKYMINDSAKYYKPTKSNNS